MKQILYLTLLLAFFSLNLNAQQFTERAVFSTGGSYGAANNYVHIYTYHPEDEAIIVIDSIYGDFSNDVVVDGKYAYVHIGRAFDNPAGDDVIYKYDLCSNERVDSITQISGSYRFLIYEDHFVVAKSFASVGANVQFYNKNDLAAGVVLEGTDVPQNAGGVLAHEGNAYISYTEDNIGKIAIYDLTSATPTYISAMSLDTMSSGIADMLTDGTNIYALSQRFDGSFNLLYAGISKIDLMTGSFQTSLMANAFNALTIGEAPIFGDIILANFGADGNAVTTSSLMSLGQTVLPFYTDGATDDVNNLLYLQDTDYFSYGTLTIVDATGAEQATYDTNISGTAINMAYNHAPVAMDDEAENVPQADGIFDVLANDMDEDGDALTIEILTQPASGTVQVTADNQIELTQFPNDLGDYSFDYQISDCWGRTATATVEFDYILNTYEPTSQLAINVSPNPTSGLLTVDLSAFEYAATDITLYDMMGNKVFFQAVQSTNQASISLNHLAAGIYLIEAQSENKWAQERVILVD